MSCQQELEWQPDIILGERSRGRIDFPIIDRKCLAVAGEQSMRSFGPMLGAFADAQWHPVTVAVQPADILVLYSDGVTDTVGSDGRFGERRLEDALTAASSAEDAVARIDPFPTAGASSAAGAWPDAGSHPSAQEG